MAESERRRHRRIPCYVIAQNAGAAEGEEDFFGVVRNLSRGGAMVESQREPAPDARVDLVFMLDQPREFREGRGRIVWLRRLPEGYLFGIQFDRPFGPDWEQAVFPALSEPA